LEATADKLSNQWLKKYKIAINKLSDERKETYRVLRSWSKKPVDIELVKPNSWMVPTTALENTIETTIPLLEKHIMSNSDKLFPVDLNDWENHVLAKEEKKKIMWHGIEILAMPLRSL
jgi:type III restriction enzyme